MSARSRPGASRFVASQPGRSPSEAPRLAPILLLSDRAGVAAEPLSPSEATDDRRELLAAPPRRVDAVRSVARREAALRRRGALTRASSLIVGCALVFGVFEGASLVRGPSGVGAAALAAASHGAGSRYVVRSGDTLWSIASRLAPGADPRPLMDALAAQVPGGVLTVGETLHLP